MPALDHHLEMDNIYKWTTPMFDFKFLNRCMIIQNLEKGFVEMEQLLIYIVRQKSFHTKGSC